MEKEKALASPRLTTSSTPQSQFTSDEKTVATASQDPPTPTPTPPRNPPRNPPQEPTPPSPTITTWHTTWSTTDEFLAWNHLQTILSMLIDLYIIPHITEDGLHGIMIQYLLSLVLHGICLCAYRFMCGRWFPPFRKLTIIMIPFWARTQADGIEKYLMRYGWIEAPAYLARNRPK